MQRARPETVRKVWVLFSRFTREGIGEEGPPQITLHQRMQLEIARNFAEIRKGMSPEQSRAARAWLGWSQTELAKRANVSLSTVRDFEMRHRTPIPVTIAAIRHAIEDAGIEFIDESGKAVGIRLSRDAQAGR